nr:hypothetical protein CFP56_53818 [Quercus suber]
MPHGRIQLENILKPGVQFQNLKCINVMEYFLMKPDYFPVLEELYLNEINIVIIPKRISKFTRLKTLGIECCKYLQEIPRLPQSIRQVFIINSHLLHPQSSNRLFSQFGEFWYQEYEILQPRQNPMNNNHVEVVIESFPFNIVQAGIHVECICPLVERFGEFEAKRQHQDQDHSTDTFPPTSIPAFPICSISNSVTQLTPCRSPTSDLELSDSYSYSMERTYNDFESLSTGFHVDGCNLSLSPYPSPMGRKYQPPQPQVIVLDQDQDHSNQTLPPFPTSYLELSNSNFMEATNNDFYSPLNGFQVGGCDLSVSPYTSPMGRNYQPPQPQVIVLDQDQDHSIQTLPPFPTSYLELSNSNSMEATYNDFDSLLNGFHVDGCDLSVSPYTSPMGRNYHPPQPQVTVLDDTSHISLPSSTELLNNMTYKSELLGMPDSGIGSTKKNLETIFFFIVSVPFLLHLIPRILCSGISY